LLIEFVCLTRPNKKQTLPMHILATNKQKKPLACWPCERGYLGAAVSSWCVSSPKLPWPRILEPGPYFSTRAESKYQRTCTDLLTHFLLASADANAAVDWLFF
jgi:hypothetical protein